MMTDERPLRHDVYLFSTLLCLATFFFFTSFILLFSSPHRDFFTLWIRYLDSFFVITVLGEDLERRTYFPYLKLDLRFFIICRSCHGASAQQLRFTI